MAKNIDNKPLTIKDIREVLIPAMEKVFATKKDLEGFATKKDLEGFATKKDLGNLVIKMEKVFATKKDLENFVTKEEFYEFKDAVLTGLDHILKDLETLMMEKKAEYWQHQRWQKFYKIITQAMSKHRILTINQANKIKQLNIF